MKTKNYIVAKKQNNGDITFINYKKIDGFKVTPKNTVEYPGIEVNSMFIVKPIFIEKILKRKNKIKLNYYLNYIIDESDDSDSVFRCSGGFFGCLSCLGCFNPGHFFRCQRPLCPCRFCSCITGFGSGWSNR